MESKMVSFNSLLSFIYCGSYSALEAGCPLGALWASSGSLWGPSGLPWGPSGGPWVLSVAYLVVDDLSLHVFWHILEWLYR